MALGALLRFVIPANAGTQRTSILARGARLLPGPRWTIGPFIVSLSNDGGAERRGRIIPGFDLVDAIVIPDLIRDVIPAHDRWLRVLRPRGPR